MPPSGAAIDTPRRQGPAKAFCTPVSDVIRYNLHKWIETHGVLCDRASWTERHDMTPLLSGRPAFPFFFQDTNTLPPFDENELDNPQVLASAAAEIYRMRRARDRHMPGGLMGEPAWDILLALYAEEPAKLPVSSVCYGSGVPPTTALRWIGALDKRCLVERTKHHRDARIVLLSLTQEGRLIVERCLKAMLRAARG
jgi:DNA-binding MarR family transcriptional regulator